MEATKVWSLKNVNTSIGPIDVMRGTAGDGDVVMVSYINDLVTPVVGGDSSTVFCENPDGDLAEITIRLLQTSKVNDLLQAAVNAAKLAGLLFVVPITVRDKSGTTLIFSGSATLKKVPDWKASKEVQVREWIFLAANTVISGGGN